MINSTENEPVFSNESYTYFSSLHYKVTCYPDFFLLKFGFCPYKFNPKRDGTRNFGFPPLYSL